MATVTGQRLFLRALLPTPDPGESIEVRAKFAGGRVASFWANSVDGCVAIASRIARSADVWFGPSLRRGRHGDAEHVSRLKTVWCDVDAKCFRDGKSEAASTLQTFPLSPSVVVDTGNGLHAYWLLEAPLIASDQGEAARLTMRTVQHRLGANAVRRLDAVHDLSRVMRLPGTWNRKQSPPLAVSVIVFERDRRYRLVDFGAAGLVSAPTPTAPIRWGRSCEQRSARNFYELPLWVRRALAQPMAHIRQTPSELDFAVLCALIARVGPEEAESIWLASALGARDKVQLRPDYRQRTISSAIHATGGTVPEKLDPPPHLHLEVG